MSAVVTVSSNGLWWLYASNFGVETGKVPAAPSGCRCRPVFRLPGRLPGSNSPAGSGEQRLFLVTQVERRQVAHQWWRGDHQLLRVDDTRPVRRGHLEHDAAAVFATRQCRPAAESLAGQNEAAAGTPHGGRPAEPGRVTPVGASRPRHQPFPGAVPPGAVVRPRRPPSRPFLHHVLHQVKQRSAH